MAYGNGYIYRRAITIDNTKVSGSNDLTNFPVGFIGTYDGTGGEADLRVTGSGGKVTSANGYDIVFYSDAAGTTQLKHELEYYDSTTGKVIAWIKIPTLAYSADTTIYLFYNKSGASDTSDKNNVWTAYNAVWHLTESGTGAANEYKDSTSTALDGTGGTNYPTRTTTTPFGIGYGQRFNDNPDWITFGDTTEYDGATELSMSYWFRPQQFDPQIIFRKWYANPRTFSTIISQHVLATEAKVEWDVADNSQRREVEEDSSVTPGTDANTWAYVHLVWKYDTGVTTIKIYKDASDLTLYTQVGGAPQSIVDIPDHLYMGARYTGGTPDFGYNGYLKEFRTTKNYIEPGWVVTDYNNQNSPSTFYSMGTEETSGVASGYSYYRTITVDNTKVSGSSNLTDFPMLVGGTYSYLKDTGNGGKVTNSNGYDIEFSSNSDGTGKLDHEIERYVNTSGEVVFWVKIPDLDYNNDTVIYMWYGNSSVTTSQENVNETWNANHKAVYHLKEDPTGGSPQFTDSTSNGLDGSAVGTWASGDSQPGQVGYALEFDGADYIDTGDPGIVEGTAWTFRAWARSDAIYTSNCLWSEGDRSSFYNMYFSDTHVTGGVRGFYENPNGAFLFGYSTSVADDSWYMVHVVQTALNDRKLYIDGVNVGTNDTTSRTAPNTAESYLGVLDYSGFDQIFTGWIDEARYMTSALTAGELVTQYNNESTPSTFYAVGAEQPLGVVGTHIFGDEGLVA